MSRSEDSMAVDDKTFRTAMSRFASGITVVTTEHEGKRYGMTVASFASVSLDPPLVLICIEKRVPSHDAIAAAGHFAVNILAEGQEEISTTFATRSEDRFAGLEVGRGILGSPILSGTLATVECEVHEALAGGDHTIFVGKVMKAEVTEQQPLIYYRSGYHRITV
jgi:flavin reductase (DIM6/NTAB) family NADH-FMN oxidoreductase RutF